MNSVIKFRICMTAFWGLLAISSFIGNRNSTSFYLFASAFILSLCSVPLLIRWRNQGHQKCNLKTPDSPQISVRE